LLTDQNEMSIRYREPSIDASNQILVHLAKRLQRRRFLEIDQLETRIVFGNYICIEDLPRMLLTKFHIIWSSGFRGKAVLEINQ
jgi:hypothetical protein